MNTIPFNINDQVKVRVTAVGHRALKSDHFELFRERGHTRAMELYAPPREDTDGWSTWTLWDLMQRLGPHMRMGNPSPIETTIQLLVGEELAKPKSPSTRPTTTSSGAAGQPWPTAGSMACHAGY